MNDLRKFENREDDWLAKQRRLEARISPWDLDDARKLKAEHEEKHARYNASRAGMRSSQSTSSAARLILLIVAIIFIMAIITVVLSIFSRGGLFIGFNMLYPLVVICIVLAVISSGGKKR